MNYTVHANKLREDSGQHPKESSNIPTAAIGNHGNGQSRTACARQGSGHIGAVRTMSKPQSMLYQNTQYSRVMNLKYKSKYKRIKERVKDLVYENATLCDEVAQMQADLAIAREERRFLIKRLMRHEGFEALEQDELEAAPTKQKPQDKPQNKEQPKEKPANVPKKRGPKKRQPEQSATTTKTESKPRTKARDKIILDANGKPMFPINLYNILIHSAGEILPSNPNFHTSNWIYPVGYVATRMYAHPKDPKRKCVFTCKILNNAGFPQFQIIPDNDLDGVFFGDTANSCHQALLELLQHSLADIVKLPMQVQGERFFGLSNPTVRTLLQMDPGFKQCANFKGFQQIDGVSGNNIAMFEDKDPTLCFEALQTLITVSAYHTMPEVKEEPPDELLNVS